MYDLGVQGVNAFFQRRPGAKRLIPRAPLSGLTDGANKIFYSPHAPFLYSSFSAFMYGTAVVAGSFASVDADRGVITFNAAPLVQPLADYTAVPLTQRQIIYFCFAGFDLMESLYTRGLALSSSSSTYVQATPEDDHAYICTSPATLSDPTAGSLFFSTSRIQRQLLERCIEFAYLDSLSYESAAGDVNFRERMGGVAVDAIQRPKNLLAARDALWKDVVRAYYAALDEVDPTGEHYAQKISPVHTDEYKDVWQWQTNANGLVIPKWINW